MGGGGGRGEGGGDGQIDGLTRGTAAFGLRECVIDDVLVARIFATFLLSDVVCVFRVIDCVELFLFCFA